MAFATPLWLLALPLLALGAAWLWGLTPPRGIESQGAQGTQPVRRHRLALAIRLVLLSLLVLTLAGAAWQQGVRREAVVFVTDLSASDAAAQEGAESWIKAALATQGPDDLAGVVAVGRLALVEHPLSLRPLSFDHFESVVDPNYTNLAGGLDLAAAMLPADARRRVVVLTDGQQNAGDALQEARLLRAEGIRVDVVPLAVRGGPEMLVDDVTVPPALHTGEEFSAVVRTQGTAGGEARLEVYVDDRLAAARQVTLSPGRDSFAFTLHAPAAGFHTVRALLLPAIGTDTLSENNEAGAFLQVQGPPRVLVVESVPGAAHNLSAALRAQHLVVDEMVAARMVPQMSFLQRYAAVFIVDTPADLLGPDLLALLPSYVGDLGHGLAVIGGPESYAMGGYAQTPLEQVLPVRMDVPQRKDTPVAAVALIVESLESDYGVNISKVAGEGVVKLLTPQDWIAVGDGSAAWAVAPRHVSDKAGINAAIDAMNPIDPSTYADALTLAEQTLRKIQAPIKHIILLGDGDATDSYHALATRIAGEGISISTVATNAQGWSDLATMQDLARWGHGRFYRADSVESIPQIFLKEAKRIARTGIVEERFYPAAVSASPLLSGLADLPELDGYVATTPKPAAENVLISNRADPVLAAWHYGLGRTVAWTSDSAGQWTAHLLSWPGAARLWGNIASWILPPAANSAMALAATATGGTGHLSVDLAGGATAPRVVARLVGPSLQASTLTLLPTAPGHYEAEFDASQQGAYLINAQATAPGKRPLVASGGLIVPYSPEFRLTGLEQQVLRGMAGAAGGQILAAAPAAARAAFADNLPPVTASRPLAWLLLLLVALLLPLDIAVRRLVVTRADLAALLAALRRPLLARARPDAATAAGSPLLRVREQRARRASTAAPRPSASPTPLAASARPPSPAPPPAPPPPEKPEPTAPPSPEGIPAGSGFSRQLLEAKRRRQR